MISGEKKLKELLDVLSDNWNNLSFIEQDPISIPHSYTLAQDKEISGFFSAIFSWGNRTTIINKSRELMSLMENTPYDFIRFHQDSDLRKVEKFIHRTFQGTDVLYFIDFLHHHFQHNDSLENAFLRFEGLFEMKTALTTFQEYFFSLPHAPLRTRKHVSSPANNATCKRLNMFLRWMVRKDERGVDFGLWKNIPMSQLYIPYDVHVSKAALSLGLLDRTQKDWKAVEALMTTLRSFEPADPVKYDFALFGLSKEKMV